MIYTAHFHSLFIIQVQHLPHLRCRSESFPSKTIMALGTDLSQSMYVVWQWCEPSPLDSACFRAGQCPHQFPESAEATGFPCFQRSCSFQFFTIEDNVCCGLPRSPHCPPSLRSQPSPDRGPLRFQVDKVTRLKAGCIFSAPLPSSSAFPTQAGSLPLSTGTQATQPWPAEQPSQHSVMDGPVHPRPRQQNPWGHCSPHQAGPQLPGVGRETAGEACRDRGQGRPRLQLRPAVPRWFSGNNPSRRRLNTEPGQWVSSWLHSLCSVYQPLRAPEAEAGSRQ